MIHTCSIGGVVTLVEPTGQVQKGVSKLNSKPKGEKQMPSCWCHCVNGPPGSGPHCPARGIWYMAPISCRPCFVCT